MKRQPVEVIFNPRIAEAREVVSVAVKRHEAVLLVGRCAVIYDGRASSKLAAGERIVVIKGDGALLVHRPKGYEPVNWMPGRNVVYHAEVVDVKKKRELSRLLGSLKGRRSEDMFQAEVEGGVLQVRAIRREPSESVRVFFDRVYLAATLSLVDAGEFSLYASERDMQKALLTEPSLLEDGFRPITYEKKVEPGFVDVYGVDGKGRLVVVEIKRRTAGRDAALQLAKYVRSVKETADREVRGMLAAPRMAKGVQRLLATLGLEFHALSPRKCAEILSRSKTKKLAEYFEGKR